MSEKYFLRKIKSYIFFTRVFYVSHKNVVASVMLLTRALNKFSHDTYIL